MAKGLRLLLNRKIGTSHDRRVCLDRVYVRILFLPARAARVRLAPGFHVWFAGA